MSVPIWVPNENGSWVESHVHLGGGISTETTLIMILVAIIITSLIYGIELYRNWKERRRKKNEDS